MKKFLLAIVALCIAQVAFADVVVVPETVTIYRGIRRPIVMASSVPAVVSTPVVTEEVKTAPVVTAAPVVVASPIVTSAPVVVRARAIRPRVVRVLIP